jgi:type IV secretory pathway TrbL component
MTTPMPYCYDAAIAAALTIALAFSVALICAIIVGPEAPNFAAGAVIFVLAGPVLL